ncbi:hypothetical protein QFC22_006137 [Naganishia vaughanmartiniae]|uniref:Uncharacterized protein n=1 Tax=Naganishia vaughanmartiniae TaxID=1424756 RepID=A0ACC2WPM4_9TREE|nr:hypothetical protein QFC22_006137 [Naganishia vaughanmartiniae]
MYLGSSPFDAPGTYSLLQWTETVEGIWYPRGGFHQVVQSLINISESHDAKYHFSSPVSHVRTARDAATGSEKANGIVLEDGTEVDADLVVVNADLAYAHGNLFKRGGKEGGKAAETAKEARRDPRLADKLEAKPHSDPSAAPEGKDGLTILVPIGHMDPFSPERTAEEWSKLVAQAKRQVIEVMEGRLGLQPGDMQKMIVWEEVNTPLTCGYRRFLSTRALMFAFAGVGKEKFNLTHGSILGISHDFFNVLAFRHQARHPTLPNAYFVGASVHPGTGVPIAIAGSRLCTEAILEDLGRPLPPSYTAGPEPKQGMLDVKEGPRMQDTMEDWAPRVAWMLVGIIAWLLYSFLWR